MRRGLKMTTGWKRAAILSAVVALTSCSGTSYQNAPADQYAGEVGGIDTNWIWAGLALGLLAAVSSN
jgi:hypothetical protein